ncbi:amidoligase family protein [Picosynechococcus sp. PCC 73109]|uniref:amidoligase family protein n=1 Tax=Picosynechococcus sp. PCC 73109 TaxID=374982 RepID=UPI0007457CBC|nr:amidoligase family protein [Picosynechococcus sp. PCC 73109]AMA08268.1 amidoligase enzyme [Picosynechococcus sp. PCC 73109]
MITLDWKIGFEIELLAPSGSSRQDLAAAIATAQGGQVHRFFHPQSEPSKVPGKPVFHNLTLGFEIRDPQQRMIAQCVDDLTLQQDLKRQAKPQAGWYRIVSDDERLLRLIARQTEAKAPLETVMAPIGDLFGTVPEPGPGGMRRVNDQSGASVAIAAPLPGERERPCELITAPMETDHEHQLETLLSLARHLKFTAPVEGATHLHFEATPLQSAPAIANLVNLLWRYGDILKTLMGTNPHCRRLGPWPETLFTTVNQPEFRQLPWPAVQQQLHRLKLTKYCDFNLVNCINALPHKNTIEVRILPVWLETTPILQAASLFTAVLHLAAQGEAIAPGPPEKYTRANVQALLQQLQLDTEQIDLWLQQVPQGKARKKGFQ